MGFCVHNIQYNVSLHIYLRCQIVSEIYVKGRSIVAQCEQVWEMEAAVCHIKWLMIASFNVPGCYSRAPLTH